MAKKPDRNARRDAAGVGPYVWEGVQLVSLRELKGWKVADTDADIRGWEVQTVSGRQIGEVEDLLVDPEAGEVVMLDIDVKGTTRRTLALVRAVQIDRAARVVRVDSADLRGEESFPGLADAAGTTQREGFVERRSGADRRAGRPPDENRDRV